MRIIIPLAALALLLAGCSGKIIRPMVEKGIRNALPTYIGPAKKYTVKVEGPSEQIMNGRINKLKIEGEEVQIDPKLLVDRLMVDMDDVHFNPKTREVQRVEKTIFQATVSEEAINKYITQSDASEYNASVKLEPGKVQVAFVPRVLGVNVAVSLTGKPEIIHGDKVNFVADSGSVAHLPVPSYVINKVLDKINPILDLSTMKFPVTLDAATIHKGSVDVSGKANFQPKIETAKN